MATQDEYRRLAEFRYELRRFQRFSEEAARRVGLEPQQHQLLLAIKGLPAGEPPNVSVLAERLQLRHNSTVELIGRCIEKKLVRRTTGADRREVFVTLTRTAESLLERLSAEHREELRQRGHHLLHAMQSVLSGSRRGSSAHRQTAKRERSKDHAAHLTKQKSRKGPARQEQR